MKKQILILGGGYGGLLSALSARRYLTAEEADITVVNRYSSHQIITELHRLAAGNVSEKAVSLPLHKLLDGTDVGIRVDSVSEILPDDKKVKLASGITLGYDKLVIALGSETAFFGIPGLQENSFVLKSVDDANRIHQHIVQSIERYASSKDPADATFVIGGGGLTGIELVGELADMLPELCEKNGVDFKDINLYVVEAAPGILRGFPDDLIERAMTSLQARGVKFLVGVAITEVAGNVVTLKDGQTLTANTVVWTGGVQGNSIVANCGIEVNRGRATVNAHLQSTSHPDIFLAGDSAVVMNPQGAPYPPTAQLAWQMGETVGYNLFAALKGGAMKEFQPVFSGTLASLGRKDAIGTIGASGLKLRGMPAALMKEASNIRYLSHIRGLFTLAY
jgi:NADH dehydrogenase